MQETYASTPAPVISDESPACPENKLPLHRSSHHTDWRADLFPMVANSNERGEFEYRAGTLLPRIEPFCSGMELTAASCQDRATLPGPCGATRRLDRFERRR